MKKTFKLLPIILACMMLVSCNNTENTTVNTSNTTVQTTNSGDANTVEPPITLDKYFGAIDFETLKNYIETKEYADEYRLIAEAYEYYHKDGYIYRTKHSEITEVKLSTRMNIRLLTHAISYDVGTFTYRKRGDKRIDIFVYHLDEKAFAENGENLADYCKVWLGREHAFDFASAHGEIDITIEGKTKKAFFLRWDEDKEIDRWFQIYFFIDDTHYAEVWVNEPTEAGLIEFLSGMTFEKVPLNIAE